MTRLFQAVLQMSISASYVILVVLMLRILLRKFPKRYSYILWSVVGFRLCCPISFSSVFSIFNFSIAHNEREIIRLSNVTEIVGRENASPLHVGLPAVDSNIESVVQGVTGVLESSPTEMPAFSPTEVVSSGVQRISFNLLDVAAVIWMIGIIFLLCYSFLSYFRLKKEMEFSLPMRENIRQAEIRSPFILGYFRPTIYIPFGLDPLVENIAISHERHHIKRKDHWFRLLAFLLLSVHWMNPLCWVAYFEMGKDLEMSCDEYVLAHYRDISQNYSKALLSFSVKRRFSLTSPLAFGESSVKERIVNAMEYKKTKKLVSALAAILCIITLVSCGSNSSRTDTGMSSDPFSESGITEVSVEENVTYETPKMVWLTSVINNIGKDGCFYMCKGSFAGVGDIYERRSVWDNYQYILKIDPKDGSYQVDCDVPGCKHNNESCPAIVRYSRGYSYFLDEEGEKMIFISDGAPGNEALVESDHGSISAIDLDSKNIETLFQLDGNDFFSMNDRIFRGDHSLYMTVYSGEERSGQYTETLKRFDLDSGSVAEVYRYESNKELLMCMITADELIIRDEAGSFVKVTASTGKREQILQTSNPVLFTDTDMIMLDVTLQDGDEHCVLKVSNYRNGETKDIPLSQMPQSGDITKSVFHLREMPDGWILVSESLGERTYDYLVNLNSSEVLKATLKDELGLHSTPGIAGIYDDYYVIAYKQYGSDIQFALYNAAGEKVVNDMEGSGYSLIRKEDYINGKADLTPVKYILD
ncbi:MAG: hypothetical protein IJ091_07565 [Oscillospiraceae bacterium]|nr:hypothetical protein [Oscillospiraceae bacterium]